jgi:hypothetical protein
MPFRVLRVSPEEHKIGLSLKQVEERVQAPQNARNGKAQAAAPEPQPPTSTTMGEKMAQAIKAAAKVSAAKRVTQAPAPQSQIQAVSSPAVAAAEVEIPPEQPSVGVAIESGVDAAVQATEEVPSEPGAAVPQRAEPETAPDADSGDGAAMKAADAIVQEQTQAAQAESPVTNGGQGTPVEAMTSQAEAETPANPVTRAKTAAAEATISEEILPAGAQS